MMTGSGLFAIKHCASSDRRFGIGFANLVATLVGVYAALLGNDLRPVDCLLLGGLPE